MKKPINTTARELEATMIAMIEEYDYDTNDEITIKKVR